MSELQAKACELIERLPEEKVRLVFALLFETALSGDAFKNDMEYFNSIPGYTDSIIASANVPIEQCTEEIGWNIP